jgi:hypothetical protein
VRQEGTDEVDLWPSFGAEDADEDADAVRLLADPEPIDLGWVQIRRQTVAYSSRSSKSSDWAVNDTGWDPGKLWPSQRPMRERQGKGGPRRLSMDQFGEMLLEDGLVLPVLDQDARDLLRHRELGRHHSTVQRKTSKWQVHECILEAQYLRSPYVRVTSSSPAPLHEPSLVEEERNAPAVG